jgi:hypothetical protein
LHRFVGFCELCELLFEVVELLLLSGEFGVVGGQCLALRLDFL